MENSPLKALSTSHKAGSPPPPLPDAAPEWQAVHGLDVDQFTTTDPAPSPRTCNPSRRTDFTATLRPVPLSLSAKEPQTGGAQPSGPFRLHQTLERWWCNQQKKDYINDDLQSCLIEYVKRSQRTTALDWLLNGILTRQYNQAFIYPSYKLFADLTAAIATLPHERAVHYAKFLLDVLPAIPVVDATGIFTCFCKDARQIKDRQLGEIFLQLARDKRAVWDALPPVDSDDSSTSSAMDDEDIDQIDQIDPSSVQHAVSADKSIIVANTLTYSDILADLDGISTPIYCTELWAEEVLAQAQKATCTRDEGEQIHARVKTLYREFYKLMADRSNQTFNNEHHRIRWCAIEYFVAALFRLDIADYFARSLFQSIKKHHYINLTIIDQLTQDTSIPTQELRKNEYLENLLDVISAENMQPEHELEDSISPYVRAKYLKMPYMRCASHGLLEPFMASNWRQEQAMARLPQQIALHLQPDAFAHIQAIRHGWYVLDKALECKDPTAHGALYQKFLSHFDSQVMALIAAILGAIRPFHDKPENCSAALDLVASLSKEDKVRLFKSLADDSAFSHWFVAGSAFLKKFAQPSWYETTARSLLVSTFPSCDVGEVERRLGSEVENWIVLHTALESNWQSRSTEAYNAAVQHVDKPYARFIATAVDTVSTPDARLDCINAVLDLAVLMTNEERHQVVSYIFSQPQLADRMVQDMVRQSSVSLEPKGDSVTNFHLFAKAFLCTDTARTRGPRYEETKKLWNNAPRPQQVEFDPHILEKLAVRPVKNGRSLFFYDVSRNKHMILKVPKSISAGRREVVEGADKDDFDDLMTEGKNNNAFHLLTPILGLTTIWPKTVGWVKIKMTPYLHHLLDDQKAADNEVNDYRIAAPGKVIHALLCEAPAIPPQPRAPLDVTTHPKSPYTKQAVDASQFAPQTIARPPYATYLYQIDNTEVLQDSSTRYLDTIGKLASVGIAQKTPVPLYHAWFGDNDRRFYAVSDLVHAQMGKRCGTGSVENVLSAFRYSNFGLTGARDAKEFDLLENIRLPDVKAANDESTILMSMLSNVVFSWMMTVAGAWYCNWYGESHVQINEEELAQILRAGVLDAFVAVSKRDRAESAQFLDSTPWLQITHQAVYFLSTAFVKDVGQGKIREGIFDLSRMKLYISKPHANWDPKQGWVERGDPLRRRIGADGSSFPPVGIIRMLYTKLTWALGLRTV